MSNSSTLFRDDTEKYHENNLHIKNRLIFIPGEIEESLATQVVKNINLLDTTSEEYITVDINSPGGDEEAGWAIYDRIRQSRCHVVGRVWGDCSSMATIILQACDERQAGENSLFLFHEGSVAKDWDHVRNFEAYSKILPKEREKMYRIYMECTELSKEALENLFKFDKYIDSSRALRMGFIDEILRNTPPSWLKEKINKRKKINKKKQKAKKALGQ